MSMVHMNKNRVADVRGEGGSQRIRTSPDEGGGGGGEGGQKRANFCGRPLWMAPKTLAALSTSFSLLKYSSK